MFSSYGSYNIILKLWSKRCSTSAKLNWSNLIVLTVIWLIWNQTKMDPYRIGRNGVVQPKYSMSFNSIFVSTNQKVYFARIKIQSHYKLELFVIHVDCSRRRKVLVNFWRTRGSQQGSQRRRKAGSNQQAGAWNKQSDCWFERGIKYDL